MSVPIRIFALEPQTLTVFLMAIVIATVATSAASDDQSRLADAEARLDRDFSGVVMAACDTGTTYARAFGQANQATGELMTLDHRFRIGSVSKTFTAALIHRLAQVGACSLSDPVSRYVSGVPTGDRITLAHLMGHRSGLEDFSQDEWRRLLVDSPRPTVGDVHRMIAVKRLKAEPGKKYSYCNVGYVLLGMVVEQVSGMPYATALQRYLLDPAGLSNTGVADEDSQIARRAVGHGPDRRPDTTHYHYGLVAAAGGMYSTAGDLVRWCSVQDSAGLGWQRGERFGRKAMWHTGNTNDFSALIVRFPEVKGAYLVLSNVGRRKPPKDVFRTIPKELFELRR